MRPSGRALLWEFRPRLAAGLEKIPSQSKPEVTGEGVLATPRNRGHDSITVFRALGPASRFPEIRLAFGCFGCFCSAPAHAEVHYTHGHRGLLSVAVTQHRAQTGGISASSFRPVSAKAHPRSDPQAWRDEVGAWRVHFMVPEQGIFSLTAPGSGSLPRTRTCGHCVQPRHQLPFVRKDSDNISVFRFNLATGKLEWTGNEHCRARLSLSLPPDFVGIRRQFSQCFSGADLPSPARYEVPSPNFVCNVVPHQQDPRQPPHEVAQGT